jgi:hypothetical protein
MERTCEVLEDLCGSSICQGTLGNWIQAASQRLAPTMERMKALLTIGRLQHTDETGMRLGGLLHWMHVNSTRWLTHYAWHRKRGQKAMDDIGILPQFQGYAMHDRLSSYDQYDCAHLLCGAHLLRDCLYVVEREKQPWAQDMHDLLLDMVKAANQWRERGAQAIPKPERDEWVAQYFAILVTGFAAHSPADTAPAPQTKGRQKQSDSKNLLDAFSKRAEQILAFLDDLSLPFSNNQAERDLRMIKVQQKISGTFRSEAGATAFCTIRSYLSTMRKQGRDLLDALAAVFTGSPFPIAWEPR